MRLLLPFMLFLILGNAYAQEVAAIVADYTVQPSFEMLKEILGFLQSIPKVGPYIKMAIEIAAGISVFCTSAVLFIKAVLSIAIVSTQKWAPKAAKAIKDFEEKILPWFKYLSMMNTSKEEMKKASIPKVML